jgi:hypothetical protein
VSMPPLITVSPLDQFVRALANQHVRPVVEQVENRFGVSLWAGLQTNLVEPAARAANEQMARAVSRLRRSR